ncbi:MAG TPA: MEDS domain-containing protein [Candidatus Bathyarchaeia archaeon]|nr:MEDS domain-containing protein [Candidatus Bathyarchaeia archaeon]
MQTIQHPIQFVDHMESSKHILLLYDDPEAAKLVMFRFIKNGLVNGEDCLYLTEEDSGSIVIKMMTHGIPLRYFQNKQLQVLQIDN